MPCVSTMTKQHIHLDKLTRIYDQIYLSPHFDDAVLGAGGAIAQQSVHQRRVLVVTVCTGVPAEAAYASPFVQRTHALWKLDAEHVTQTRDREDSAALAIVGADGCGLGLLDAIYRRPDVYRDNDTLFGTVALDDTLVADLTANLHALMQRYPQATLYAPLGIGLHVDHQIAYTAAACLARDGFSVAFYEDFPYVTVPGALEQRMRHLEAQDETFVPQTLAIDATIEQKIRAIQAYASQLDGVFGDASQAPAVVRRYARGVQPGAGIYGERFWRLKAPMTGS